MNIRALWYLVAIIGLAFFSLRRLFYHLNYAVPHYLMINLNHPPYVVRYSYPGYPVQWRYVVLYGLVFLFLSAVLVAILHKLAEDNK